MACSVVVTSSGTVRIGEASATVEQATLELFHLFSQRPDWVLDVQLAKSASQVPRLWLAGTGEPAPYTRERRIDIAYVDAPTRLTLDGREGRVQWVAPAALVAIELGAGRARVDGRFSLVWTATGHPPRTLDVVIELVAAVVT